MRTEPLWKAYERQIFSALREVAGDKAVVTFDADGRQRLPGRHSGIDRQIDVLVKGPFAGRPEVHTMIVDCKKIARTLDVTHVESFAGLLDDVGATIGLLVTTEGFTPAARRRAEAVRGMILDVVQLDDLAKWRARKPTIAITAGASNGTLSFHDDDGTFHTEWVPLDLARRLLDS